MTDAAAKGGFTRTGMFNRTGVGGPTTRACSFFEMLTRDPHPDGRGRDLRFDSSNAQGIFAMTRR